MAVATTRIRLCGRLEACIEGTEVSERLRGRQGRLLFAYLVLHRDRPVRREELVEALWPDGRAPGPDALAPVLSRVRAAIGAARLEGRAELRLRLGDDAWVDWEAAHAAVAQGGRAAAEAVEIADLGLLPGLEAPWIDQLRGELADLRVEALEALAGVAAGNGQLREAERAARAAVDAAPFRESARLALMRVLQARGNVAEALRVFDETRVLLREELGTTPGAALVALNEALLTGPAAAPAAAAPADELVARDRERAQLERLLRDLGAGEGRVAAIEGPAGIGKTRLLTEGRRLAEAAGALVLPARASQLEREFPFGVVRQLFEALLAAGDDDLRERALSGPAALAAGVFEAAAGGGMTGDASFSALHGLYWLVLNLAAERRVVLAVDDLQWADRPSLLFLAYLSRRLEGQPVLLAATVRSGEASVDGAMLAELLDDPATVHVRPGPLGPEAVGAVVTARLGAAPEPAFLQACVATTGGNPLLLRQLLVALEADDVRPTAAHADTVRALGSRAVASTVRLRLGRLSPGAEAVAQAIAVLGEDATLATVAALSGLDREHVAGLTAELVRAEVLRREAPLGFAHPLVLEAIYSAILPGERELAHGRAARVLRDAGVPPERIATHLLVAPPAGDAWAAGVLRSAAALAMRTSGPGGAAALLRRALAEPPPEADRLGVGLELGLSEVLFDLRAGRERLLAVHAELPDPAAVTEVGVILATMLIMGGDPPAGAALARATLPRLPAAAVDDRRQLEAMELMAALWRGEDLRGRALLTAADLPIPAATGARMHAAVSALASAYLGVPAADCAALARAALADDDLLRRERGLLTVAAGFVLDLADDPGAGSIWDTTTAHGHLAGSLLARTSSSLWGGYSLYRRGDLADAAAHLRDNLELADIYGYSADALTYRDAVQARIVLQREGPQAAWKVLSRLGLEPEWSFGGRMWWSARLELLAASGRHEEALELAARMRERFAWVAHAGDGDWARPTAAALHALGRSGEALDELDAELEVARRWGTAAEVGGVLRARGALTGDAEALEEAVALLERSQRRLELAKAVLALAAQSTGATAVELRQRGHGLAVICDAGPLARAAEAALLAAGARPDPAAATGPGSLTRQEQRALTLDGEGRDVREIAQQMFLTPREAEQRLTAARRKLDGVLS